ncbi:MAG: DUF3124 domain-containing protein [Thermodesulfobacteriota bacterium]
MCSGWTIRKGAGVGLLALSFILIFAAAPSGAELIRLLRGQTVYLPAYSHIYGGDREQLVYLTVTLSIRNTDPENSISVGRVGYYSSEGNLIQNYLDAPLALAPMASTRYVVPESNKTGGSGASFIVQWSADRKVTEPLIESVMIGIRMQQGISFTSRGKVIEQVTD